MARKASSRGESASKSGQKVAFDGGAKPHKQPQRKPRKKAGSRPAATSARQARRGPKPGGRAKPSKKREIEQYPHDEAKRLNNPEVGLVNASTDPDKTPARKTYAYDPHLDPQLQWAGKAEHTSFEVDSVSLHVHERIDPLTIVQAVKRKNGGPKQLALFERPSEKLGLRDAIDFYRHAHGWSNRLIAGDSLLVMNSLIEKEGLAGQVQMVYIDPPYGIKYGSNFQPFVNKRDVKDRKDEDLTQEPEMIRAFRDTWELGIHSYLTYLRDRLLLARQLLHESGSCFVQISDENLHHVRELMDEVFGPQNLVSVITFKKTTGAGSPSIGTNVLPSTNDYLVWYGKDVSRVKYRQLYWPRAGEGWANYNYVLTPEGEFRRMTMEERANWSVLPVGSKVYRRDNLTSSTSGGEASDLFTFEGRSYSPFPGGWKTSKSGLANLLSASRMEAYGKTLAYRRFADDFPWFRLTNLWDDTVTGGYAEDRYYVVQTGSKVLQRCLLMTTDPGDLVLDPTCGSGTTAYVAEQWGRRWITCDSSRVSVALAKQRLMTADFDYFEMARPEQGVASGFVYKTVPHVTLKSIANNPEIKSGMTREQIDAAIARHAEQETLYDQPRVDKTKVRVTGPFTVEAVPAPAAIAPDELARGGKKLANLDGKKTLPGMEDPQAGNLIGFTEPVADASVARSGETLRQQEWRDELLKCGIRAKGGAMLHFSRVEPLAGTRWLHAEAETREAGDAPAKKNTGKVAGADTQRLTSASVGAQRVVISFGPEHAPLEQRQVEKAIDEAYNLKPRPQIVLFASFQFDPEAAKDIDELKADKIGMQVLKVQMNTDLLTDDLKKKRSSNESFWLVGQPDVTVRRQTKAEHEATASALKKQLENDPKRLKAELDALEDMHVVEVAGFDYYNPKTGMVESGGADKIAMWMLDTDYNGRSLYPRQVFFPMAGKDEGWAKLAKSLKAELDEDLIEQYRGTVSLPFALGKERTIAVKIIDDRGIESLRVMEVG